MGWTGLHGLVPRRAVRAGLPDELYVQVCPMSCAGRSGLLAVRAGRTSERTWTRRWGKTVSGAAAAVWSINIFAIIAKINSAHLTGPCEAGFMVM